MQIDDPAAPQPSPLLRLAFRPGFLAAGGFALISMCWWLAWLWGQVGWSAEYSPNWWHGHEMLFGFAMPVVVGFLLTAVATWTGVPGTTGRALLALFACWALARICLLANTPYALWIGAAGDSLFVLGACFELGRRVWSVRQKRNYLFIPVLLLFAILNLLSYGQATQPEAGIELHSSLLLLFLFLIAFVGGRVIPFFTSRRLQQEQPPILPWLDFGGLVLLGILVLLIAATGSRQYPQLVQGLLWANAMVHLARLARWWSPPVMGVPLLWSLHLSYLFLPLGLAALAWSLPDPNAWKTVLHLLAIGTMAGMILAMMARVSLGHTGRPLEIGSGISTAFVLLALAALLRGLLPLFSPDLTVLSWRLSALLWIAAFGIFTLRYLPILSSARPDGRPG